MSSLLKERLHAVEGWQGRIGTKLTVAGECRDTSSCFLVPVAKHVEKIPRQARLSAVKCLSCPLAHLATVQLLLQEDWAW